MKGNRLRRNHSCHLRKIFTIGKNILRERHYPYYYHRATSLSGAQQGLILTENSKGGEARSVILRARSTLIWIGYYSFLFQIEIVTKVRHERWGGGSFL